jgi:hypothetical protein
MLPGEARGSLVGLLLFALGFAVAGVLVAAGAGSTPAYYITVSAGLIGIGVLGFFSRRVPTEVQPPPVWSPRGTDPRRRGRRGPRPPRRRRVLRPAGVGVLGNSSATLVAAAERG